MKKALMVVLPVLISIGSASRLAAQPEPETSPEAPSPTSTSLAPAQRGTAPVETHGFASQGFILTTGNDLLAPNTTNGSFEFSEAGLNVTTEIGDNLRIGIQAFAQNISQNSNFTFRADWFYVDYRFRDWLGIRAGRLKIPFGLYNEISDIDAARAPILLPQSVYPLQGREFLFAQTGGEVYGFVRTPAAGALEYRLYGGTIFIDPRLLLSPGSTIDLRFYVKYVVGGRLFWETPLEGLRVGVSLLAARLDLTEFQGGMVAGSIRVRSALALGSAEYTHDRLMLTAEYSRWSANQESDIPSATQSLTSERAYAMVSIRTTPWLQPTAYYAIYFPDVSNRDGSENRQDDVTLSVRFDVMANWIVKLEGHYMSGTAGLRPPLSVTLPPPNPAQHWSVFLAKTTGYF